MKILTGGETMRISRRLALFTVLGLWLCGVAACGGGGGSSGGDEDDDIVCPECFVYNNGQCVPDPDCRKPDGDDPDGDTPDGDVDGDRPDGDTPDGDVDGDQPDGDVDGDDPEDGDRDYEIDIDPEEIPDEDGDVDPPDCIYGQDWMCGSGMVCTSEGRCVPDTSVDGDLDFDDDIPRCQNGQPVCVTHDECPRAVPCDMQENCCDPGLPLECEINDDCPFGMFCSGLEYCDYHCIADDDCNPLRNEYCTELGVCLPFGGADEDEEERPPCLRCQDCLSWFGPGFYCHQEQAECLPQPSTNGCCDHSNCTAMPNGVCNLMIGQCIYYSDPTNRGGIAGTIYVHEILGQMGMSLNVRLYNEMDQQVGIRTGLFPTFNGEVYSTSYAFSTLPEDSYNVKVEIAAFPQYFYMNPFNPIFINYFQPSTTLWERVDFYVEMTDPRLARLAGLVHIHEDFQVHGVEVQLFRENPQTETSSRVATIWAEDYDDGVRPYEFDNLTSGHYYVRGVMRRDEGRFTDYYSSLIDVTVTGGGTGPLIQGADLYFGVLATGMGRVSGKILFEEPYTPDMFAVYLFNWPTYPYPVAEAALSSAGEWELDFQFTNIEAGNYWILGEVDYYGEFFQSVPPGSGTVYIESGAGTTVSGLQLSFDPPPDWDPDGDYDYGGDEDDEDTEE